MCAAAEPMSPAVPDSTTNHPTPAAARRGLDRRPPAATRCTARARSPSPGTDHPGNRQVTGAQHVGAQPARQRIQHRRRTRPGEAAHGAGGQHRDLCGRTVDRRRDRRPARAGSAPAQPCPPRPRPSRAAPAISASAARPAPSIRGPQPSPQRHHRARTRQRVSGHRQRHPLLPVAQHAQAGRGVDHRAQHVQTRARSPARRVSAPTPRPAPATASLPGGAATRRQIPAATTRQQHHGRHHREKRCPRTGYGLAVPDPAEAGQAAQRAQTGLGARRERGNPERAAPTSRSVNDEPSRRGRQPRQRRHQCASPNADRGADASAAGPHPAPHADQRHRRGQHQPGRGQPGQRDPERQRRKCRPRRVLRPSAASAPPSPPTAGSRSRPADSSAPAAAVRRHRDSRSPA